MIDEIAEQRRRRRARERAGESRPAPLTRAEQREATRQALIDAAARCLVEEGYASVTTRRVAELAGVAQSTLMHHFATRDALLVEAVTSLATRMGEDALLEIDLSRLNLPEQREAVLDQAWARFSSPQALAVAQIWSAAWSEPELAATLRSLESRIDAIISRIMLTLFPDQAKDPRAPAMIGIAVALIRGLVMAIPVSGREVVEARWQTIKPLLLEGAARVLGETP